MPTCKDCLHFKVCEEYHRGYWGSNAIIHITINNTDTDDCPHFKDRSKFIELPYGVGDSIYYHDTAGTIYKEKISDILVLTDDIRIDLEGGLEFSNILINKKFFLSPEGASKALKERKSKKTKGSNIPEQLSVPKMPN